MARVKGGMNAKKKRELRKSAMMDKTNEKVMKKILPYL